MKVQKFWWDYLLMKSRKLNMTKIKYINGEPFAYLSFWDYPITEYNYDDQVLTHEQQTLFADFEDCELDEDDLQEKLKNESRYIRVVKAKQFVHVGNGYFQDDSNYRSKRIYFLPDQNRYMELDGTSEGFPFLEIIESGKDEYLLFVKEVGWEDLNDSQVIDILLEYDEVDLILAHFADHIEEA